MRKDLMRTKQMLKKIKNPLMKVEGEEGEEVKEVKESQFKPGTGQPKDPNVNTTNLEEGYDLKSIPASTRAYIASSRAYQEKLKLKEKNKE